MRIALLSDIHGNLTALETVLTDIQKHSDVEEYWLLGDLVAIDPQAVIQKLRQRRYPAEAFTVAHFQGNFLRDRG